MRSFILPAAIVAALATLPTASFAATRDGSHAIEHTRTGSVERGNQPDRSPPETAYPGTAPWMIAMPFADRGGRLAAIEGELRRTMHEISTARRLGELTPGEARFVRREDGAVRTEAISVARHNGGRIPMAEYAMLQQRVGDLDRVIHRYETGMARG